MKLKILSILFISQLNFASNETKDAQLIYKRSFFQEKTDSVLQELDLDTEISPLGTVVHQPQEMKERKQKPQREDSEIITIKIAEKSLKNTCEGNWYQQCLRLFCWKG